MITEQDLNEAIAQCIGTTNPTAETCKRLAAFYTVKENLYPKPAADGIQEETARAAQSFTGYARAQGPMIDYDSGTEFSEMIRGRDIEDILPILDDLLETLAVINPRLYKGFIRKLNER